MVNALLRLYQKNPKKAIGLMSGTSADGIDACLIEIFGNSLQTKINILAFETYPYDDTTRNAILDTCNREIGTVDKVCQLNFHLGKLFASVAKNIANKARIPIDDIDLIGSHGQTVYHIPDPALHKISNKFPACPSTLQIGEPSVIAQETGVTTIADFRPRDMAAGGHGAPLVPYVDFLLFRDKEKGRTLQNIGGIANVTFLPPDCNINEVIAFDTGPGNMLIDRITELITNNTSHFDEEGKLASTGNINDRLLTSLLKHPYLTKPPPKTTGREVFGKQLADNLYEDAISSGVKGIDILTTVTAFTAHTIADSYKKWILSKHELSEVIISGGGSYNKTLIKFLKQYLTHSIKVYSIHSFGISPNAKEAIAFAILANETISGNPNNVPSVTGANEPVIMGKIIPGKYQIRRQ
jgi:anhydro-N-acetylmuramic acid kinase